MSRVGRIKNQRSGRRTRNDNDYIRMNEHVTYESRETTTNRYKIQRDNREQQQQQNQTKHQNHEHEQIHPKATKTERQHDKN
mmetsp:Transcript_36753/g.39879  ORF Transcript_36753/g.39879 Transcript_36753/m.39879 type:complete len:82 (+) Transcript_36753:457-702(+)